ncbi:hypothetical protein LTR56_026360 [Elasticomyces elasticus]|nr:hypothetical protein LTR56_026360 [Elasticomyces elasticus]KAK3619369.1 hypothetical protein LTR22_026009 [Elasticomyces elasticus]KAK4904458.1 hypothetical protein LTR49_026089 [Elasticomyces elasticus]
MKTFRPNTDFESGAEGAVARRKEYNVELEKNKEPIANHEAVVKESKAAEEQEMDAEITLSNAEIERGQWKTTTDEQQNLINWLVASSTA